jgi:hypothetical protein
MSTVSCQDRTRHARLCDSMTIVGISYAKRLVPMGMCTVSPRLFPAFTLRLHVHTSGIVRLAKSPELLRRRYPNQDFRLCSGKSTQHFFDS